MSSTQVSEKRGERTRRWSIYVSLNSFKIMTINELKTALSAKGITFSASATKPELEALLAASGSNSALSDDLQKKLEDVEGFTFGSKEFAAKIAEQRKRIFPDYGKKVPEGEYVFTGKGTFREWTNPRNGNTSTICCAYLADDNGNLHEVSTGSFATPEWNFVTRESDDSYKKLEHTPILGKFDNVPDRNEAVAAIPVGTKVKVHHANGHYDNPLRPANSRIFDFIYTWVSAVE